MARFFSRLHIGGREKTRGQPGLFVHIPKTAGISFRDALEESQRVIFDYGTSGPKTSQVVLDNIYRKFDPYAVYREVTDSRAWLAGHFRLAEHADIADCRRIVAFVRNPVDRVISQFNHAHSYMDTTVEIESFVDHEKNRNVQYKRLQGLPRGCIGFIGITEKFRESLEMINGGLALQLSPKYSNKNETKRIEEDQIPPELYARIRNNNQLDMEIYDWAVNNHDARYRLFTEGKRWCHGFYTIREGTELYGVAFFASGDEPVEVNVVSNGRHIETLTANLYHHGQVRAVFPRSRYVAFRMELADPRESYEVVVSETGQTLSFQQTAPNQNLSTRP